MPTSLDKLIDRNDLFDKLLRSAEDVKVMVFWDVSADGYLIFDEKQNKFGVAVEYFHYFEHYERVWGNPIRYFSGGERMWFPGSSIYYEDFIFTGF